MFNLFVFVFGAAVAIGCASIWHYARNWPPILACRLRWAKWFGGPAAQLQAWLGANGTSLTEVAAIVLAVTLLLRTVWISCAKQKREVEKLSKKAFFQILDLIALCVIVPYLYTGGFKGFVDAWSSTRRVVGLIGGIAAAWSALTYLFGTDVPVCGTAEAREVAEAVDNLTLRAEKGFASATGGSERKTESGTAEDEKQADELPGSDEHSVPPHIRRYIEEFARERADAPYDAVGRRAEANHGGMHARLRSVKNTLLGQRPWVYGIVLFLMLAAFYGMWLFMRKSVKPPVDEGNRSKMRRKFHAASLKIYKKHNWIPSAGSIDDSNIMLVDNQERDRQAKAVLDDWIDDNLATAMDDFGGAILSFEEYIRSNFVRGRVDKDAALAIGNLNLAASKYGGRHGTHEAKKPKSHAKKGVQKVRNALDSVCNFCKQAYHKGVVCDAMKAAKASGVWLPFKERPAGWKPAGVEATLTGNRFPIVLNSLAVAETSDGWCNATFVWGGIVLPGHLFEKDSTLAVTVSTWIGESIASVTIPKSELRVIGYDTLWAKLPHAWEGKIRNLKVLKDVKEGTRVCSFAFLTMAAFLKRDATVDSDVVRTAENHVTPKKGQWASPPNYVIVGTRVNTIPGMCGSPYIDEHGRCVGFHNHTNGVKNFFVGCDNFMCMCAQGTSSPSGFVQPMALSTSAAVLPEASGNR